MTRSLSNRIVEILSFIAFAALLRFILPELQLLVPADLMGEAPAGVWSPLVNISHNAFHLWRLDPFIEGGPFIESGAFPRGIASLIMGAAGVAALVGIRTRAALRSLSSGIAAGASIYLLFGADTVILGAVAPVPWILAAFEAFDRWEVDNRLLEASVLLFLGSRLAASGNQLAPAIAILLLGLRGGFQGRKLQSLALALPCLLVAVFAPVPTVPSYPLHAQVVPYGDLPAFNRPLVGPETVINFIDRSTAKKWGMWALLVLAFSVVTVAFRGSKGAKAALLLSALVLLDGLLPGYVAQILPLESLRRVVPGLIFFPLAPLALALALLFLVVAFERPWAPLAHATLLLALTLQGGARFLEDVKPGLLHSGEGRAPLAALEALERESPSEATKLERLLLSPSYGLVARNGIRFPPESPPRRERFQSALDFGARVTASVTPDALHAMIDKNNGTRWSSGNGMQRGGEWVMVELERPTLLRAIEATPGTFQSDFPVGVRVETSASCEGPWEAAVEFPEWRGPIRFTRDGFPYYDAQPNVKLYFDEPKRVRCVKITQTGASSTLEWSIAEINLLPGEETAVGSPAEDVGEPEG